MQKTKNLIRKVISALLSLAMVLSGLTGFSLNDVQAATYTVRQGRQIWYSEFGFSGGSGTHYYYVNAGGGEKLAYCVEPYKSGPTGGSIGDAQAKLTEDGNIKKAFYYGYGGPGQAEVCDKIFAGKSDDFKYVATHVAVSYFYNPASGLYGMTGADLEKNGIFDFIDELGAHELPPDPAMDMTVKDFLPESITDDTITSCQSTLVGDYRNYIEFTVPHGATLHTSDGTTYPMDTPVQIHAGTTFWFSCPNDGTEVWAEFTVKGAVDQYSQALVLDYGEGVQKIGLYNESHAQAEMKFNVGLYDPGTPPTPTPTPTPEQPSTDIYKTVGSVGSATGTATTKENPYLIRAYDPYDYQIEHTVAKNNYESYVFQDTLEDPLTIDNEQDVIVKDQYNQDVSNWFDITIEGEELGGQKITVAAKESTLARDDFSGKFTLHLTVHRAEGASVKDYLEENYYVFDIPNKASVRYALKGQKAQTVESNTVWVQGRIVPDLVIDKVVSKYEWEVGDIVDYTVKVTQKKPNAWAINTVVKDISIPKGLDVIDRKVESPDGVEHVTIKESGDNGWEANCPLLQYDESIVIHFTCKATQAVNGTEIVNTATAECENFSDEYTSKKLTVQDSADVWINTADLHIDKTADHYEWQVGDDVEYKVVVINQQPGTIAKNVEISDISLPEGLQLKADPTVSGWPSSVDYPVADEKDGMATEEKEAFYKLEQKEGGWFLKGNFLPAETPITITFQCTATDTINGVESVNQASALCDNNKDDAVVWDDAEIYTNTAVWSIDKTADHYEWKVGEDVEYTVVVENTVDGTIARDVVISDTNMPEGLALNEGEDAITVEGIPETYINKIAGTVDPSNELNPDNYNETEEVPIESEMLREGTGWKLTISNLPAKTPVKITFKCQATEEANGKESVNKATVTADNSELVEDDAEVYVNTANLKLTKSVINNYLDKNDNRLPNEFRVGETVEYQVKVENLREGSIARNLVITDTSLPEGLKLDEGEDAITVEGIMDTITNPIPGTSDRPSEENSEWYNETEEKKVESSLTREGTGWKLEVSDLPCTADGTATPIVITFKCTVQQEVNGWEIINRAHAVADNAAEVTDDEKVWINTPQLRIFKDADKSEYKYGDIATYTINVYQAATGCVARNVVIEDVIDTAGVKLQKNSIVLLDENGKKIDADIEVVNDTFIIHTNRNLVDEDYYTIWDKENGGELIQSSNNPLNEQHQVKMTVEYQAAIVDPELAGKDIQNTATVNSDEDIPDTTIEVVPVHSPVLDIVKESDKIDYSVGETGHYKLTVRQLREDVIAKQVVITDQLQTEGAYILPETLKYTLNGKTMPDAVAEFNEDNTGFTLTTGVDMGDEDKIEVYYDVYFEAEDLTTVVNHATAKGENTPEEDTDHEVNLADLDPVLNIVKTADKEQYAVGDTGHYTVDVTQTKEGATARRVILKDKLQTNGAKIVKDSVKVYNRNGVELPEAEIETTETGYVIYTNYDMEYGDALQVKYDVLFESESLTGEQVTNVASVTADNAQQPPEKDPEPVKVGNGIEALKTSDPATGSIVKAGGTITYHIKVTNTSNETKKTILVKDAIPELTEFVEDTQSENPATLREIDGQQYATWIIKNLEPDKSQTVSFNVKVSEDATEFDTILNIGQVRETTVPDDKISDQTWESEEFKNTNETIHHLDKEWVSDDETVDIVGSGLNIVKSSDKDSYVVGETGTYTLTVSNDQQGSSANNVVVSDTIETPGTEIDPESIKVFDNDGKRVTDGVKITMSDEEDINDGKLQAFTVETGMNLAYGEHLTVQYQVLFKDASLAGQNVRNVAIAKDDSTPPGEEPSDDHEVPVNDPGLSITKTSDKYQYKVGETAVYNLVVTQTKEDLVAENVVIEDYLDRDDVDLDAGSITILDNEGLEIKEADITTDGAHFRIETHRNLAYGEKMTVQYKVVMTQPTLVGHEVKNTATVSADNAEKNKDDNTIIITGCPTDPDNPCDPDDPCPENPDDPDNPCPENPDDPDDPDDPDKPEEKSPILKIEKDADKDTYKVGDTAKYTIVVTQTVKDQVAKNVVIEDKMNSKVSLDEDSFEVKKEGKAIDYDITFSSSSFHIATNTDLAYGEEIKITYAVDLDDEGLEGCKVINTATASADNADPEKTENTISVAYEDTTKPKDDNDDKKESSSSPKKDDTEEQAAPKTGLQSYAPYYIGGAVLLVLLGVAGLVVFRKKRRTKI